MGKPNKKLKKIFIIMGMTGAVYGSFRFLLPLVIPFLLSWGIAAALRPSAGGCRSGAAFAFVGGNTKYRWGQQAYWSFWLYWQFWELPSTAAGKSCVGKWPCCCLQLRAG